MQTATSAHVCTDKTSSTSDGVVGQPLKFSAVQRPCRSTAGGDTSIVVEIYRIGAGASIVREGSSLTGREGTLEFKSDGKITLVLDVLACCKAYGFVIPIEGDISSIFQALQTVDQKYFPEFGFTAPHKPSKNKTVILSLPSGCGKSKLGKRIASALGCSHVVDEWSFEKPLLAGALHLTNREFSAC